MKLQFKIQPFQTQAVESVVDCFVGQPKISGITYRIAPGAFNVKSLKKEAVPAHLGMKDLEGEGFKNADIQIPKNQILENIRSVQKRQNLPLSEKLIATDACDINLDVEMETGTGKTYCYIKTIFEMNKRYGWSKFIVVVPSIAIREGVYKSLEITAEHFTETYGKKIRFFIYSSKQLHQLESFSSDGGINVMVINIQAFNATGKDNRRIYDELDDFQSRRPISVINSNRPILILDEPQKMEGKKTLEALEYFNPLMILRYSATHRRTHNKVHRLDALDAYNQKLVKKIAVRGITVKGLSGTKAYLYLESIEISKKAPLARMEIEVRQGKGIKRIMKRLEKGTDLFTASNELDQYRGFVISQIDAFQDKVEFTNGEVLYAGDATGDVTEETLRKIQIRETIKAHFEKEQILFSQGIKVLSLFFIDEVAKYRDYSQEDEKGEYARIFEEEYENIRHEWMENLFLEEKYRSYLKDIAPERTHNGYFAIDKKSKKLVDPKYKTRGEEAGLSDDVDAYDLILKDKEKLLSFEEPTRFIFSHSALREGWDNPNVFVLCMLKHSDNTVSRRQEVGRGLRLSVDAQGNRMDQPATVHEINVLTVVANESYKDFVSNLQSEVSQALSDRPRKADEEYFTGKTITTDTGSLEITPFMAKQIYRYLIKNDYTDDADAITETYHEAKGNGTLATLPPDLAPHEKEIFGLIDSVFSEAQIPGIEDDRKPKKNLLNENFQKKEFQELWERINRKAVYRVDFDSAELITKSIQVLNEKLQVSPLQYTIQGGVQEDTITDTQLRQGEGFSLRETKTEFSRSSIHSGVSYDLLGKIAENTNLTRKTVGEILTGIAPSTFDKFKQNPEHFIAGVSEKINEQKATMIIEKLTYDVISGSYDVDIFTKNQQKQDFSRATKKLKKHIYDYAIIDSKTEKNFVEELDTDTKVVVYAKLPRGFLIPTPVGNYNPDWTIVFEKDSVKHIYFVAETKGTMSTMEIRTLESTKIQCAHKFFEEINKKIADGHVRYGMIKSYGDLMDMISR